MAHEPKWRVAPSPQHLMQAVAGPPSSERENLHSCLQQLVTTLTVLEATKRNSTKGSKTHEPELNTITGLVGLSRRAIEHLGKLAKEQMKFKEDSLTLREDNLELRQRIWDLEKNKAWMRPSTAATAAGVTNSNYTSGGYKSEELEKRLRLEVILRAKDDLLGEEQSKNKVTVSLIQVFAGDY